MRIGFFDSGIGGISVLKEAVKALPCEDYIYFADVLHAPYGTKSSGEVTRIVHELVEKMVRDYRIDMLVIACNTATSVAVDSVREKYAFPVIGIEPAVKPAVEKSRAAGGAGRVLVLATELTLREERFRKLLERYDDDHVVDCHPMQKLVAYADRFDFNGPEPEEYIRTQFKDIDLSKYDTVVLGCTHFAYFRELFTGILPEGTTLIDGTEGIVKRIRKIAGDCPDSAPGSVEFHSTDPGKIDADELKRIYESI
jgi:glutamate racemase